MYDESILSQVKPNKTYYLAADLMPKKDPNFHPDGYSSYKQLTIDNVTYKGSLYSPTLNNISLKVINIKVDLYRLVHVGKRGFYGSVLSKQVNTPCFCMV